MLYPVSQFTFYSFLILFPNNELNESTICEKSFFIRFLGMSVNDSIIQIMITSIMGKHSHSRQVTQPMFKRVFSLFYPNLVKVFVIGDVIHSVLSPLDNLCLSHAGLSSRL
jgi:hypothetical protein